MLLSDITKLAVLLQTLADFAEIGDLFAI